MRDAYDELENRTVTAHSHVKNSEPKLQNVLHGVLSC